MKIKNKAAKIKTLLKDRVKFPVFSHRNTFLRRVLSYGRYFIIPIAVLTILTVFAILKNTKDTKAATLELIDSASSVTVNVSGRYKAVLNKTDTTDYLLIYDRAQSDTSPSNTYEFYGPYIREASTDYQLRYDNSRETTLLEVTDTRVRVRVEGCFDTTGGGACLTSGSALSVIEEYTFTLDGIFVANTTNLQSGIDLDTPGSSDDNGYNFLMVDGDIQDNAFAGTLYYGDGTTEASTVVDATFANSNSYVAFPAVDASGYQSGFIGLAQNGWFNYDGGTQNWRIDINVSGTIDRLSARLGNFTTDPTGNHTARWYFILPNENSADSEAERESFNNNYRIPDEIAGNSESITTGNLWPEEGASGSIDLDGTTDRAYYADTTTSALDITGSYTLEAWIKFDDVTSDYQIIIDKSQDANNVNYYLAVAAANGELECGHANTGVWDYATTTNADLTTGVWYYIACVHDTESSTITLYRGGTELDGQDTSTGTPDTNNDNLEIGNDASGAFGGSDLDAQIEEIRISNMPRDISSQPEIPFTLDDATVALYHFNEGSGTTSYDSTSNNFDLTFVNQTHFITSTGKMPEEFNELEGTYSLETNNTNSRAIDFDGDNDYLTYAESGTTALDIGDESFTLESWVKFDSVSTNYQTIVVKGADAANEINYFLGTGTGAEADEFHCVTQDNLSPVHTSTLSTSGVNIQPGKWYYVACIYDNAAPYTNQFRIYVNGYKKAATSIDYYRNVGDGDLYIGDDGTSWGGNPLDGTIEEVRISDTARSIYPIHTFREHNSVDGNTVALYHFNEGSGTTTYDETANNFDLTLTNNPAWADGYYSENYDSAKINQAEFDIDGSTYTRHKPLMKFRKYRSSDLPNKILLEGTQKYWGENFNRSAKPFSESWYYDNSGSSYTKLSEGGNLVDANEYLNNQTNNYTLDFDSSDYFYLGSDNKFTGVNLDLATVAAGSSPVISWQYCSANTDEGSACDTWTTLPVVNTNPGVSNFTSQGNFYFNQPTNWVRAEVNTGTRLYFIRGSLTSGSFTTDPVENKITTDILLIQLLEDISSNDQTVKLLSAETSTSPILYWKLDEGYGSTAHDTSVNHNDGTISYASWQQENLCVDGKCLHFDGDGDYISLADTPKLDFDEDDSFTLEAWIRHKSSISAKENIIAKYLSTTGTNGGYELYLDSSGYACAGIDDDNSSFPEDTACATTNLADSQWHYVTAVKDQNSSLTLYVDGLVANTNSSLSATGTLANEDPLYVGINGDGASNDFDGAIDEVKVYRYARGADEIKSDFIKGSGERGSSAVFGDTKDYLSEGLIGYWKMDETSGNASDSSGNATTLTNQGTATYSNAKFGNGTELNGSSQYFDVTDNSVLSVTSSLTLAAWIKPDDVTSHSDHIVGKFDDSDESYQLIKVDDEIRMYIDSSSNYETTNAANLSADITYHVTGVYDSVSQTVKLYVNGEVEASTTTGTIPSSIGDDAGEFSIGAKDTGGTPANYFDGHIDEVRIYNRALSPTEIRDLYNWAPGPVGHWKLDEGSGTRYDSSGYGNSLTDNATVESGPGKFGKAADFEYDNAEYLSITDANQNGLDITGPLTITAWVKPESTGDPSGYSGIVSKADTGSGGSGNAYSLNYDESTPRKCNFGVRDSTDTTSYEISSTSTFANDTWTHIAAVYDGGYLYIYWNGVSDATPIAGPSAIYNSSDPFNIGHSFDLGNFYFDGLIDNVRIYNYARTQAQIIEDMNAGHPAPGSPVGSHVAYWKFDEGYGTTAYDSNQSAGGSEDLTLSTASWTNSGMFGKAWNGDGTIWVSRANDADLDFSASESFSLSGWFKSDSATNPANGTEYLLSTSTGNTDVGYQVYAKTTGVICFGIDDDGTWTDVESCTSADYYDGTWHHFTATRDVTADTTNIYIDAILKDSDTDPTTATLDGNNVFYIGDFDGDNNATSGIEEFAGNIDEVKVFRFALTENQVKTEYNRGAAQLLGATSTDSSNNVSWSAQNEYCPPGQGTSCTAPVAHWKLDENTGTSANDVSGNNNTLTLINSPTYTTGKFGSCINFPGSNAHLTRADDSDFDFAAGDSFTLETWFKHSTASSQEIILSKFNEAGYKLVMESDGDITCGIDYDSTWTPTDSVTSTSASYDDNNWHHIACVKNANTSLTLYIDCVSVGTPDTSLTNSTLANSDPLYLGIDADGTSLDFNGNLDNAMIYNYARTPAQIAWNYNRGGPVGWWKLDECQGTTIYDSSGNGNNGSITIGGSGGQDAAGTCTSGDSGDAWYNGASGKRNYSLSFDGTDDYTTIADPGTNSVLDLQNFFTISAWVKFDAVTPGDTIIVKSATSASGNYNYALATSLTAGYADEIACGFFISEVGRFYTTGIDGPQINLQTGQWYLVTCTFDDGEDDIDVYLNGKLVGYNHNFTYTPPVGNESLYITTPIAGSYLDGQIDDVRIYNYALTAQQIKTLYNDGTVRFGP